MKEYTIGLLLVLCISTGCWAECNASPKQCSLQGASPVKNQCYIDRSDVTSAHPQTKPCAGLCQKKMQAPNYKCHFYCAGFIDYNRTCADTEPTSSPFNVSGYNSSHSSPSEFSSTTRSVSVRAVSQQLSSTKVTPKEASPATSYTGSEARSRELGAITRYVLTKALLKTSPTAPSRLSNKASQRELNSKYHKGRHSTPPPSIIAVYAAVSVAAVGLVGSLVYVALKRRRNTRWSRGPLREQNKSNDVTPLDDAENTLML